MPFASKFVHSRNKVLTILMIVDKLNGATYGQIANKYERDKSNVARRVKKYLKEIVSSHDEIGKHA